MPAGDHFVSDDNFDIALSNLRRTYQTDRMTLSSELFKNDRITHHLLKCSLTFSLLITFKEDYCVLITSEIKQKYIDKW